MANQYSPAPEVEQIAQALILDYHTHLSTARIKFVFCAEPSKRRGQIVWGKAKLVTGLNAWLVTPEDERSEDPEPFFVLEIARLIWDQLDDKAQRALVDHELSHFDVDIDSGDYRLMPHDLEEFTSVVRRHGLWRPEVSEFVKAGAKQARLPGFDKITLELVQPKAATR
ncbi:MAG TPA: putative metallopeptidase [Blastocatellia bacterium]|nr:putative metallopeptidase [Blastocatellia bacterium]HMV87207.1 putative metallopeptidase [Blastocatellia bacterium]HMX25561.1 putative metallopeptidase [Blastocatellia bacterium]HMY70295.1 putative metallopeptidase [Blastocatellia bacterium]HMZ18852.1 putative metallopeptidase [Blastocatellia bacterium]